MSTEISMMKIYEPQQKSPFICMGQQAPTTDTEAIVNQLYVNRGSRFTLSDIDLPYLRSLHEDATGAKAALLRKKTVHSTLRVVITHALTN